jgi:hypothetical protein
LNGYQAVEAADRESVIIAGTVDRGAAAPFSRAALLRLDTGGGAPLDGSLYGFLAPPSTNAGNDVAVPPFSGGFLLSGATSDFGFGLSDNYFVKTLTDLSSGCREEKFVPPIVPFPLIMNDLPLEIVRLFALESLQVPITPLGMESIACYKPRCIGDLNGDGFVDDADFVIFATAYNFLICPTDPRFDCCPADLNGDGFVDDADFVIFATAYNALLCP